MSATHLAKAWSPTPPWGWAIRVVPLLMRLFLFFLALLATARADHGRDFLLLQDYEVPQPWSGHAFLGLDWTEDVGLEEWGVETGLSLGIAPRLSFGLTTHSAEREDGWGLASLTPAIHIQLTPPGGSFPVKAGLWAGYAFALEESSHLAEHSHAEQTVCGSEFGPDAPPCDDPSILPHEHGDATHDHSDGIHLHDQNAFQARLILETDLTAQDKLLANFILVAPEEGKARWGYGLGYRHSFHHDFALGMEFQGDFDRHGRHEALLGAYYSPLHTLLVKLGGGCVLTSGAIHPTLRLGAVWRF